MSGSRTLLDVNDLIVNTDAEKGEMFNRYFCSVFGTMQQPEPITHNIVDGTERSTSITKEDVRK